MPNMQTTVFGRKALHRSLEAVTFPRTWRAWPPPIFRARPGQGQGENKGCVAARTLAEKDNADLQCADFDSSLLQSLAVCIAVWNVRATTFAMFAGTSRAAMF